MSKFVVILEGFKRITICRISSSAEWICRISGDLHHPGWMFLHINHLREFPGTPRNGTPFWEASHTTPINSWKLMGSLWEPYGKGVPFWGAPGNSLEPCTATWKRSFFQHFGRERLLAMRGCSKNSLEVYMRQTLKQYIYICVNVCIYIFIEKNIHIYI